MSHSLIKFLDVHPFLGDNERGRFLVLIVHTGDSIPPNNKPLSKILPSLSSKAFFWLKKKIFKVLMFSNTFDSVNTQK